VRNRFEPARNAAAVIGPAMTVVLAAATLAAGCGKSQDGGTSERQSKLPPATTFATLRGLPADPDPSAEGGGTVVHPTEPVPVSATPGGPPVAMLPDKQLGGPTWVPVVETKPGWQRVLLPSRPNRVTGWLATGGGTLQTARTRHVVKVDTSARRLVITNSGRPVGTWTVAVGAADTPTPPGRTFMLASLAPPKATYSPLILPVGAHSETLDTFGGGPGTVAFHGWPDKSVFGKAVTHGCVRVPADALKELSRVPLGTPVLVTA
jgi:lipoprotein-anchoring transpeptidase ErfK/SrfK